MVYSCVKRGQFIVLKIDIKRKKIIATFKKKKKHPQSDFLPGHNAT
jgi:hypothetical protein